MTTQEVVDVSADDLPGGKSISSGFEGQSSIRGWVLGLFQLMTYQEVNG